MDNDENSPYPSQDQITDRSHWIFNPFGDDEDKKKAEPLTEINQDKTTAKKRALKNISDQFNSKLGM